MYMQKLVFLMSEFQLFGINYDKLYEAWCILSIPKLPSMDK